MPKKPAYKRIMLKISGEALLGGSKFGIDSAIIEYMVAELRPVLDLGVEVGIIIGGGNFFRGKSLIKVGLNRTTSDHMGMLGTILNALAMRDIFQQHQIPTRVMSALAMPGIVEQYDRQKALRKLRHNNVVIFAAGTGNPFVTTDTALSLRATELDADLLLKATNVDGVFAEDPRQNKQAKMYKRLTYKEAIDKELAVMDLAAFSHCRDYNLTLRVFNFHKPGALSKIIVGDDEGTLVINE